MVPGEPGEPGSQGRAGTRPKGVWELRGGDERCSAEHQREREETVKQSERNDLRMRKASKGNAAALEKKENQVLDEADPTSIICRRPGNTSKGGSRASSIPPAEIGWLFLFPFFFFFFPPRDISKKVAVAKAIERKRTRSMLYTDGSVVLIVIIIFSLLKTTKNLAICHTRMILTTVRSARL